MKKKYKYTKITENKPQPQTYSLQCKIWTIIIAICLFGILLYVFAVHSLPKQTKNVKEQPNQQKKYMMDPKRVQKLNKLLTEPPKKSEQEQIKFKNNIPIQKMKGQLQHDPVQFSSFVDSSLSNEVQVQITLQQLSKAKKLNSTFTKEDRELDELDKQQYEAKYHISNFKQKPICIVVPTFNNGGQQRFKYNIDSILRQQYQNFRVLVIDDQSDDQTGQKIRQYIQGRKNSQKITIKINEQRKMAMQNILYAAKNFCKPYQLFTIIDGDDYLLGKQVFKLFNAIFSEKDCWIAYSNFLTTTVKIGYSRPYTQNVIEQKYFRKSHFVISHLRVFYTKLLLLVDENDLKDSNGNWLRAANDVAIYMPMMEMSHNHLTYIRQLNYYYNSETGLNNHQDKNQEQKINEFLIRFKKTYDTLTQLFTNEEIVQLSESQK